PPELGRLGQPVADVGAVLPLGCLAALHVALDPHDPRPALADDLDLRLAEPDRPQRAPRPAPRQRARWHVPRRAALEVDPEVEAADAEGDEADQDDGPRHGEPPELAADEVEGGLAVVQPPPQALALGRHPRRHYAPPAGTAASPRATPRNRASVKSRFRPSRITIGRVKKNAVTMSRAVDRPSSSANPRTDPTVSQNSRSAAMSETRSAARMVR